MTPSLMIAANVLANIALIGGLSWAMSRPGRLTPHGRVDRAAPPTPSPTLTAALRRHTRPRQSLLPASSR